ncbi:MAG: RCC1 domain-containing protein, partial [Ilumatobacteraceae bacterium]
QVKCWGTNGVGTLGSEDSIVRGAKPNDMGNSLPVVNLGTGRKARSLAPGSFHTCAILDNFSMKCWGDNDHGQLGYGNDHSVGDAADEMGDYLPAVAVAGSRRVTAAVAGYFTCALLDDGSLRCWGNNDYGQLGTGDLNARGDDPNEMGLNLRPVPMTG